MKKNFARKIDQHDPFWQSLNNDQIDFLAQENLIMVFTTLSITNVLTQVFISLNHYADDTSYFRVQIPVNTAVYLLWVLFIWQGTSYEKFFNQINLCAWTVIVFVYIGAAIFSVMQQVTDFNSTRTDQHITKILMIILDLCNTLFIYF